MRIRRNVRAHAWPPLRAVASAAGRGLAPAVLVGVLAGCSAAGPATVASETPSAGGAMTGAGSTGAAAGPGDSGSSGPAAGPGGVGTSPSGSRGTEEAGPPVPAGTMSAARFASQLKLAVAAKKTTALRMTGGGAVAQGVMRYGPDDLAMSLTMTQEGRRTRVILVGDVYYLDVGEKVLGKTWTKIDLKGTSRISKTMGPLLATLRQQTDLGYVPPSYQALTVAAAQGPTIAGVSTVNYTLKQNSQQLVAALPAAQRAALSSALAATSAVTTFSVGHDWLPRKVVVVTTTKGKSATTTITYSKWGGPVTITPPPVGDTTSGQA
ncbi:MAG TPA: hypothetical protein VI248_09085 [Kineosporiaceae bacterium]